MLLTLALVLSAPFKAEQRSLRPDDAHAELLKHPTHRGYSGHPAAAAVADFLDQRKHHQQQQHAQQAPIGKQEIGFRIREIPESVSSLSDDTGTCVSHQVYALMIDAGMSAAERVGDIETGPGADNKTTASVIMWVVMFLSLFLLLCGQMVANITLVILAPLTTALLSFVLFFVWLRKDGEHSFVPCVLPLIIACVLGLLVFAIIFYLVYRLKNTLAAPLIYGLAIGYVAMFFLRSIIISAAPAVLETAAIDYFWLAATLVAVLFAGVSLVCITDDGKKSVVIIIASSAAGAYGCSSSAIALNNLYAAVMLPSWTFVAVFIGGTVFGFLFQWFVSSTDAEANREASRRRLRGEELTMKADPLKESLARP